MATVVLLALGHSHDSPAGRVEVDQLPVRARDCHAIVDAGQQKFDDGLGGEAIGGQERKNCLEIGLPGTRGAFSIGSGLRVEDLKG